jgi:hypothetical protein
VPGNHDVPLYNAYLRFVGGLRRFRRYIGEDRGPPACPLTFKFIYQARAAPMIWGDAEVLVSRF